MVTCVGVKTLAAASTARRPRDVDRIAGASATSVEAASSPPPTYLTRRGTTERVMWASVALPARMWSERAELQAACRNLAAREDLKKIMHVLPS